MKKTYVSLVYAYLAKIKILRMDAGYVFRPHCLTVSYCNSPHRIAISVLLSRLCVGYATKYRLNICVVTLLLHMYYI